jgi:hypothetical protein
MSRNSAHRARTEDPARSCRAWAGGLNDEEVAELRRRVEEDAVVCVALALAHAERWDRSWVEAVGDTQP